MKRILNMLIVALVVSCACFVANAADKDKNVYYLVAASCDDIDGAHKYLKSCPDFMVGPIYEAQVDGKTVYRVCPLCFVSKENAESESKMCKEMLNVDTWVWTSKGLAKCVERGINLAGEPNDLTPIE